MVHEYNKNRYNVYNTKIIHLKNEKILTVYKDTLYNKKEGIFKRKKDKDVSLLTDNEIFERERQRKKYYNSKKNEVANLIEYNYSRNSFFVTLTYKKETSLDNFDTYMKEFKSFINRLNYNYYKTNKRKVKYIATWEYKIDEKAQKRRHFHFHLWIDFRMKKKLYIKNKTLNEIWGNGFVNIKPLLDIDPAKIGVYLTKYLTKDIDLKANYRKSLLMSRNLNKPKETKLLLDLRKNKNEKMQKLIDENQDKLFQYERYYKGKFKSKVGKIYLTNEEWERYGLDELQNE